MAFLHAKDLETPLNLQLSQQNIQPMDCISIAIRKRVGQLLHNLGDIRRIVGDSMRQDSSMCLGVREVETAAQCVAELVVDSHAHTAQTGSTQPGTVQGHRARGFGRWILDNLIEGRRERPRTFNGHHIDDRVGISGVKCLDYVIISSYERAIEQVNTRPRAQWH